MQNWPYCSGITLSLSNKLFLCQGMNMYQKRIQVLEEANLKTISGNLNQIVRRMNAIGNVYKTDVEEEKNWWNRWGIHSSKTAALIFTKPPFHRHPKVTLLSNSFSFAAMRQSFCGAISFKKLIINYLDFINCWIIKRSFFNKRIFQNNFNCFSRL